MGLIRALLHPGAFCMASSRGDARGSKDVITREVLREDLRSITKQVLREELQALLLDQADRLKADIEAMGEAVTQRLRENVAVRASRSNSTLDTEPSLLRNRPPDRLRFSRTCGHTAALGLLLRPPLVSNALKGGLTHMGCSVASGASGAVHRVSFAAVTAASDAVQRVSNAATSSSHAVVGVAATAATKFRRGTTGSSSLYHADEPPILDSHYDTRHASPSSSLCRPKQRSAAFTAGNLNTQQRKVTFDSDDEEEDFWDPGSDEPSVLVGIVQSPKFSYLTGGFIIFNAVALGAQTHYMAKQWTSKVPLGFIVMDAVVTIYFLIEISLRAYARGAKFFMHRWQKNMFDSACTVAQIFELCATALCGLHYHPVFTFARMLRLFKCPTYFPSLNMFTEFRMLFVSVGHSVTSLFWTIILILMVVYVAGVFLTQVVTTHKVQNSEDMAKQMELEHFFGSLDKSMFSMYQAMSEGIHWHELVSPLSEHCSHWVAYVFAFYMAFVIFAMLNVVTGRIVESAIHVAKEDKKRVLMKEMYELFQEADRDHDGTINRVEFEAASIEPRFHKILEAVGLDTDDARALFKLLDVEGMERIDFEEFVQGCVRIDGPARAADIATFMREWQEHAHYMQEFAHFLLEQLFPAEMDSKEHSLLAL